MSSEPETTVIGVRHGEVHNPDGVIYAGLPGFGLSDTGLAQAQAAAACSSGLRVAALYSSPLQRALETAGLIADACGVEVVPDDRLHEWRYWTRWAGRTWDELREADRDAFTTYLRDPGGLEGDESFVELRERVLSWLRDVRKDHPAGLVIGVTHLEPLRAALLELLGMPTAESSSIQIGVGEAVRLSPRPDPRAAAIDQLVGSEPTGPSDG